MRSILAKRVRHTLRILPRSRLWLALAALVPASAGAQAADPPAEPPPLALRIARELAPPGPPVDAQGKRIAPGATRAAGPPGEGAAGEEGESAHVFLRADRLEGTPTRVEASGRVELRTRHETVLADWLAYDLDRDEIHGRGNVTLRQGSDWVTGAELKYRREDGTGFFDAPRFGVGQVGGRGDAARLDFVGPNRFDVFKARMTTCAAPREDWFLTGETIELDTERKVGVARGARLDFHGVPLLYSPWVEFPLADERKSGFLTPVIGQSGTRGFDVAVPYYLNLAPNYDATVVPRIMTKRGFQLGGQFRYLLEDPQALQGEMNAEFMPHDRQADESRWLVSWRHNQQFTPWLAGYVNFNKVSDDKYFADLAERITVTSQSTLAQEGGLSATWGQLNLQARWQQFQTLQDPNAPILPPYDRVPQVLATLSPVRWGDLSAAGLAEYAHFRRGSTRDEGTRGFVYPQFEWRYQTPGAFVAARASVHARLYDLPVAVPGGDSTPSVVVPIGSVDAGLVYERDMSLFGKGFVQTLEPRAFYVYVPYRNQNDLPVFDTALDDFNFLQLFSENRYLGNDRIGDANELTLAVTSRLIEPATGVERLRVLLGQRFYFEDQRVKLPGEAPRSGSSSDVLLGVEGRITDAWLVNALVQENTDSWTTERFNAGVRWNPEPGKVISGVWRFNRQAGNPLSSTSELKQFDIAAQWPLTPRWTLLGRWNYSFVDSKTLEALAGVEYNADCWVLRAVVHRLTTTSEQGTTSVYVQLELSGLARIGTNPLDLLRRSVPGFLRSNDPARQARGTGIDPYPEF
jgi:LPS-assembly protein